MTRPVALLWLAVGCTTAACQAAHPTTTRDGLQLLVQRVNEQSLLGDAVVLEAHVDGEQVHMTVLRAAGRERLDFTLVLGTAEPGIAAGPYVIPWPPERPVPPEVRTVARLTNRIFTSEVHTTYSPGVLVAVRGAMVVVALVLLGTLLDGIGIGRHRRVR